MRPSRRFQIGLGPWLRALPTRLPDPALTAALSKLEPHVRVAYVLRYVEGLPRYAVHDQLVELRVREPWPVIRAAEAATVPAPGAARSSSLRCCVPSATARCCPSPRPPSSPSRSPARWS